MQSSQIQFQKQPIDMHSRAENNNEVQNKFSRKETKGQPTNPVVQLGQNFRDNQDEQEYAMPYEAEMKDFRNQIQTNLGSTKTRKSVEIKPQRILRNDKGALNKQSLDKLQYEKAKNSVQNLQQNNLNEKRAQIAQEIIKKAQQNKKKIKNTIIQKQNTQVNPPQNLNVNSNTISIELKEPASLQTQGSLDQQFSRQIHSPIQPVPSVQINQMEESSDQDIQDHGSIDLQFQPAYVFATQDLDVDEVSSSEQPDTVAQLVSNPIKDKKVKQKAKVQTISTNTNSGSLKRNTSPSIKKQKTQVLSRVLMAAAYNHAAQQASQQKQASSTINSQQFFEPTQPSANLLRPQISADIQMTGFQKFQGEDEINLQRSNVRGSQQKDQTVNRRNKFDTNLQRSAAREAASQSQSQERKIYNKMNDKRQFSHKRNGPKYNFQFQVCQTASNQRVNSIQNNRRSNKNFASQPRKQTYPGSTLPTGSNKWANNQLKIGNQQRPQTTNPTKYQTQKFSQHLKKGSDFQNAKNRGKTIPAHLSQYQLGQNLRQTNQNTFQKNIISPKQNKNREFDNISPVGAAQAQTQAFGLGTKAESTTKWRKMGKRGPNFAINRVDSLESRDSLEQDNWDKLQNRQEKPSMSIPDNQLLNNFKYEQKPTFKQDDEEMQLMELMKEMRDFEKTQMFQKQRMDDFEDQIIKRVKDIQKYAKNINLTIKKQIQPDILMLQRSQKPQGQESATNDFNLQLITHDQQIQEITQQLLEKNNILQSMMTFQEQIMHKLDENKEGSDLDKVKQWWSQEIKQHKKHFHQIEEVKRATETIQKQNQFHANNIDNLQQQISSQIQLNSNLQESHINIKHLEKKYQDAIHESEQQIYKIKDFCEDKFEICQQNYQSQIDALVSQVNQQPPSERLDQLHQTFERRVNEIHAEYTSSFEGISARIQQLQDMVQAIQRGQGRGQDPPQIPYNQVGHSFLSQEQILELLESLKIELQVFGHDQNEILKQQMLGQMQRMLQQLGVRIPQRDNPNLQRQNQAQQQHVRAARNNQRGVNPAIQGQPQQPNHQNAENENIQFDRSRQSEGAVSASIRRAATEIQEEDHPHLLAMQDSQFDQIEGSYDNERQHQSQQNLAVEQNNSNIMNQSMHPVNQSGLNNDVENIFRDQEQLHISHESNLDINVGALVVDPGAEDAHNFQAPLNNQTIIVEEDQHRIQRQLDSVQQRLETMQSEVQQFSRGFGSLQETLQQLDQRVLSEEDQRAQSIQQVTEIKETAQIILQNLHQIQSRVHDIESQAEQDDNNQQIDSSSARADRRTLKSLKDQFKKDLEPLFAQCEQNYQDLQTIQHLIGMIQDSNFQKQIDNLRRIVNRHLRTQSHINDGRAEQIENQNLEQNRIDYSPNAVNIPNSGNDENVNIFNQGQNINEELFEEEVKIDNQQDIYLDRDNHRRRNRANTGSRHEGLIIPNLESPQRFNQDPSIVQNNINQNNIPHFQGRDNQVRIQNVQQQQNQFNQQLEISQDQVQDPIGIDSRSSSVIAAAADRNRGVVETDQRQQEQTEFVYGQRRIEYQQQLVRDVGPDLRKRAEGIDPKPNAEPRH